MAVLRRIEWMLEKRLASSGGGCSREVSHSFGVGNLADGELGEDLYSARERTGTGARGN